MSVKTLPIEPAQDLDPREEPTYTVSQVSRWLGIARRQLACMQWMPEPSVLRSFYHLARACQVYWPNRVELDSRNRPVAVFPRTRKEPHGARPIVIRAGMSGGLPCVAGTGIRVDVVADRFCAGESVGVLASDYKLENGQVQDAIRFALLCARR